MNLIFLKYIKKNVYINILDKIKYYFKITKKLDKNLFFIKQILNNLLLNAKLFNNETIANMSKLAN